MSAATDQIKADAKRRIELVRKIERLGGALRDELEAGVALDALLDELAQFVQACPLQSAARKAAKPA